jgi:hypothetical protein
MKYTSSFLLVILFVFFNEFLLAQNSEREPNCIHVVKKSSPSPIIKYLSEKYGMEDTERILLNKSHYESVNGVTVLFGLEFSTILNNINQLIATAKDLEVITELNARKAKLVNFLDIENQLIKK